MLFVLLVVAAVLFIGVRCSEGEVLQPHFFVSRAARASVLYTRLDIKYTHSYFKISVWSCLGLRFVSKKDALPVVPEKSTNWLM
jgi:hypothetical protein